ncbi:hypothetical protein CWATWH0402_980 [Crocosphaera watsonii WH 0402]|uniref:Uncharacterized protein n=1 Tax=Crocosphaera watsonii WH 0402 TaxID=1284629 RepID=T2JXX8_CROWT|nr:addiction module protein [Crocosphaera watsonii]CCQ70658.1 hypothetical protein CWATWH0402_980 [Crocosphaera watsonii WH 0402]
MNITETLNKINALNIEDRIFLVQAIWDSIAAEQVYPDLNEEQKKNWIPVLMILNLILIMY